MLDIKFDTGIKNYDDQERLKKLAYHLRHLSIRLITNDELEVYVTDFIVTAKCLFPEKDIIEV